MVAISSGGQLVAVGQVAGDLALVGLGVRDVEVVGLRGRRRDVVTELLRGGVGGLGDDVVIVVDADQLDDAVGEPADPVLHHLRLELHGPGLPVDVGSLGVGHVPVRSPVEPHVEVEGLHVVDEWMDEMLGQGVLLHDLEVRCHRHAAVEGGERRLDVEGVHQHLHPARGAAAGQGEEDAGLPQAAHGVDGGVGEHLVLGDERPVHVGEEQPDRRAPPVVGRRVVGSRVGGDTPMVGGAGAGPRISARTRV